MKNKIIFICIDWFTPAYKAGGPIVSILNLIENFNRDVRYKIWCSDSDLGNTKLNVDSDKWCSYNDYTDVWYSSSGNKSIRLFKKLLIESNADILYINGIYSLYFNIFPMLFGRAKKVILAPRGMLHTGSLSQKKLKKGIFIGLLRFFKIPGKLYFHATNQIEREFIEKAFGGSSKIFIAENFPKKNSSINSVAKTRGLLKLSTIALISPMKNLLNVLDALMKCKENIEYEIYGPVKDSNYWMECNKLISAMPFNVKIAYYGEIVPDKLHGVWDKTEVYVQPSKSENFGHSLFEALSNGKPVITSHNTPWNHLEKAKAGFNINPENIEDLSKLIDFFAKMGDEEYREWNLGTLHYVSNSINTDDINLQYRKMFELE